MSVNRRRSKRRRMTTTTPMMMTKTKQDEPLHPSTIRRAHGVAEPCAPLEKLSSGFLKEFPKQKSELVEHSYLKAPVGSLGRSLLPPAPAGSCRETGPSSQHPPLPGVAGNQRATSIFPLSHPVARRSARNISRPWCREIVADWEVAVEQTQDFAKQQAQEIADQQI